MNSSRVSVQKNRLRFQLRRRLERLTRGEKRHKNRRIFERLIKTLAYRRARTLFTYIALPSEVETLPLIQKSLALRKRVYVPKINVKTKEISIFEIYSTVSDLKRGPFGIPEPFRIRPGKPEKMDLVIVPALGFDLKGRRLGRGEGYFDRFLPRAKKAVKIGLAFREQMVREIPAAAHDIPVNLVITD